MKEIQTVECYKCPCGKVFRLSHLAAECCDNNWCTECKKEKATYSYPSKCRGCLSLQYDKRWEDSEKREWEGPFIYSDVYDKYMTEDDLVWEWEEDFPDEDFNLTKAAQEYRLYVCQEVRPRELDLPEDWYDYAPDVDDWEPPKGWKEVQRVYNEYVSNCDPFSYISTRYGLKV